jgi:uncharacterized protein YdeI (YjbR/CyaY-like superfamily)
LYFPPANKKITMNIFNPKVDFYFTKAKKWKQEVDQLRMIILSCSLTEELKWGCPCYTYEDSNIVLIHDFKEYCAVLFFKGALLKDPKKVLIQQTKNVQSARQMRFTNVAEVIKQENILKAYIKEAIKAEKAGLKVELKKPEEFEVAEEFKKKLEASASLKKAFYALTPGRQRAYLLHFSAPKQSATRTSRVEKCTPQIIAGKGLND